MVAASGVREEASPNTANADSAAGVSSSDARYISVMMRTNARRWERDHSRMGRSLRSGLRLARFALSRHCCRAAESRDIGIDLRVRWLSIFPNSKLSVRGSLGVISGN